MLLNWTLFTDIYRYLQAHSTTHYPFVDVPTLKKSLLVKLDLSQSVIAMFDKIIIQACSESKLNIER